MNDEFCNIDQMWMQEALQRATKAEQIDEVPVGAIVVQNKTIIGEGWNQPIATHNPAAHAEILAIQQAAKHLGNYRTLDTTLYVTLEPCPMCAGLMVHARISRLVFGAYDAKTGSAGSVMNLVQHPNLNHQIEVVGGVLQEECASQLSKFFQRRRAQKKRLKQQG